MLGANEDAYMDGEGDIIGLHVVGVPAVAPSIFVLHIVVEEECEIIDCIGG